MTYIFDHFPTRENRFWKKPITRTHYVHAGVEQDKTGHNEE